MMKNPSRGTPQINPKLISTQPVAWNNTSQLPLQNTFPLS